MRWYHRILGVRQVVFIPWGAALDPTNPLSYFATPLAQSICRFRRNNPVIWGGQADRPAWIRDGDNRFWNDICAPFEPPLEPYYPFGGQCPGVAYEFYLIDDTGAGRNWTSSSGGGALTGPLLNVQIEKRDQFDLGYDTSIDLLATNVNGAQRRRTFGAPSLPQAVDVSQWTYQIRRQDGQADVCPDLPDYPIPPEPPPVSFPITINNDNRSYPVTVNVPGLDVNNWPDFTFIPRFAIGPIEFEVNPEGISIPDGVIPGFSPSFAPTVNLTPVIDASVNINNNLQAGFANINVQLGGLRGNRNVDLSELIEKIECCCGEYDELSTVAVVQNSRGGNFNLPDNCVGVVVSVSGEFTPQTPVQSGSNGGLDVYHWGSVAVSSRNGAPGSRTALQYSPQCFEGIEGIKFATVQMNYNNRCNIVAIIRERNCP